jgi:hypothetical protein
MFQRQTKKTRREWEQSQKEGQKERKGAEASPLTVAHHSWPNGYGNAYNCRLARLAVSNIVAPFFSSLHCLLQLVMIQSNLTPFPPQVQPRLNTTIHS